MSTTLNIDELLGNPTNPSRNEDASVQNSKPKPQKAQHPGGETRRVQVKSAVLPSEKDKFERLARFRGKTLSDFIRDYLLEQLGTAKADGFR